MQKRFLALALTLCLALSLCSFAAAGERDDLEIIVDDAAIVLDTPVYAEDGATFVPYWPVVKALYPTATLEFPASSRAVMTAPGLTLEVLRGKDYLIANDRCIPLPDGTRTGEDGSTLLPARVLGTVLGADVAWDPIGTAVVFTSSGEGPIAPASEVYDETDLYWLSRIINAESGNQPLEGKIAVGNVVLNRVRSSSFPNTVKGVIYQKNQFSPAASGSVKRAPNAESVVAAKLCLEGANTIGNALFFVNPKISRNCWAARNRTYVATIGAHAFYA